MFVLMWHMAYEILDSERERDLKTWHAYTTTQLHLGSNLGYVGTSVGSKPSGSPKTGFYTGMSNYKLF